MFRSLPSIATAGACLLACSASVAVADDDRAGIEFFEKRVRPVLVERCYECHSRDAKTLQGGLRLDSRAGVLDGGDTGPGVVPGSPEESLLIEAVQHESDNVQMPPDGKLPAEEIAILVEWVRRGAPLPADTGEPGVSRKGIDFDAGRQFWSFQPPSRHAPPEVRRAGWIEKPIDAFVLARLENEGLEPSPSAERRVLIRRVYFDVIGLPPAPEEVERFVNDPAPDAYARLVDRLLASPHYGERWARYWLDLARYSDQTASWLDSIGQAWLYRDWVVQALNEDMPYDRFVMRQLAADLIPGTSPKDNAALGFLGLSPVYWKELKLDKEVIKGTVAEEWEERIDAIGRTFLGLSLACARCHDHKFDPISAEDYYALAGVIAGTRLTDRPTIPAAEAAVVRQARESVQRMQDEIKKLEATKPIPPEVQEQIAGLKQQITELERNTPFYDAPMAHGVDDAALDVLADGPDATKLEYRPGESCDLHVQIRGNPSSTGPLVPRRFLTVLSEGKPQPFGPGSGRRELAEAIVGEGAPLSARVIVNRVWAHHFGRGLVDTPSDFGAQGSRPTHPELLDDLTARFVEHGWSLKWLHREILLSATYQQCAELGTRSAELQSARSSLDPENRLLWRMNRRRLEIEVWRDAMLAANGSLDRRMGGPAVNLQEATNRRRTIYGRVDRYELDAMLRLYDFPDPLAHAPGRTPTTTALQQLFVLNSPFFEQQATALAERVIRECPDDVDAQINQAHRLLFGRGPTNAELSLARKFLSDESPGAVQSSELWRQYAQVLLGSNESLFVD